ncbi:MAG: flagellar biosynthetic protein FliO [Stappiaceae bacterium]
MGDWLVDSLGMDPTYARSLQFLIAAIIVLALIGIFFWIFRRVSGGSIMKVARSRQQRLSVMDAASVDARRRLVLVRRDNVEHLLLIGGPTDVVVEEGIMRGVPATQAARPMQAVPGSPGQAPANEQPIAALPLANGPETPAQPALHPAASTHARRPAPQAAAPARQNPQNMAPQRPVGQPAATRQPMPENAAAARPQPAASRQAPSRLQPAGQPTGAGAQRFSTPAQNQLSPSPRGNPKPPEPATRPQAIRATTPAEPNPSAAAPTNRPEKADATSMQNLQNKVADLGSRQKSRTVTESTPSMPVARSGNAPAVPAATPVAAATAPVVASSAPEVANVQTAPANNLASDFEDALLGPTEPKSVPSDAEKSESQDFAGDLMRSLEQPAPVPQSTRQRPQAPANSGSVHALRPEQAPEPKTADRPPVVEKIAPVKGAEQPKAPEVSAATAKGPKDQPLDKETDAETFDSIEEEMAKLLNEIGGNSR